MYVYQYDVAIYTCRLFGTIFCGELSWRFELACILSRFFEPRCIRSSLMWSRALWFEFYRTRGTQFIFGRKRTRTVNTAAVLFGCMREINLKLSVAVRTPFVSAGGREIFTSRMPLLGATSIAAAAAAAFGFIYSELVCVSVVPSAS